jgi:hypothetical protein
MCACPGILLSSGGGRIGDVFVAEQTISSSVCARSCDLCWSYAYLVGAGLQIGCSRVGLLYVGRCSWAPFCAVKIAPESCSVLRLWVVFSSCNEGLEGSCDIPKAPSCWLWLFTVLDVLDLDVLIDSCWSYYVQVHSCSWNLGIWLLNCRGNLCRPGGWKVH